MPVVAERDRSRDLAVASQFGTRLRAARVAADLTQEQLAEAAALHPTFISNVERGYRIPTIATVVRLMNALDVSASVLLDGLD